MEGTMQLWAEAPLTKLMAVGGFGNWGGVALIFTSKKEKKKTAKSAPNKEINNTGKKREKKTADYPT